MTPSRMPWFAEATPVLPHLASEFLLWLWWGSEERSGAYDFGGETGSVDFWVDTRIAFRAPNEAKVGALLTGDNPAATLEARAAVVGGKVPQEICFGFRRQEREFFATLRAPSLDLVGIRLPQEVQGGGEEALYDRMYLFEELLLILKSFFVVFSQERVSPAWEGEVLPAMKSWIRGEEPSDMEETPPEP